MAAIKDEISAGLAARLADELATAWPAFPTEQFTSGIDDALARLALMARVDLLADRLTEALPLLAGLTLRWSSEAPVRPSSNATPT